MAAIQEQNKEEEVPEVVLEDFIIQKSEQSRMTDTQPRDLLRSTQFGKISPSKQNQSVNQFLFNGSQSLVQSKVLPNQQIPDANSGEKLMVLEDQMNTSIYLPSPSHRPQKNPNGLLRQQTIKPQPLFGTQSKVSDEYAQSNQNFYLKNPAAQSLQLRKLNSMMEQLNKLASSNKAADNPYQTPEKQLILPQLPALQKRFSRSTKNSPKRTKSIQISHANELNQLNQSLTEDTSVKKHRILVPAIPSYNSTGGSNNKNQPHQQQALDYPNIVYHPIEIFEQYNKEKMKSTHYFTRREATFNRIILRNII